MSHRGSLRARSVVALALALLAAHGVLAQTDPATAAPAGQTAAAEKPFKEEELAALLAPIALYPDQVLALVFMASTYPLEVVQANRWLQQNQSLKGEELATAAKKQPWDESVQGLTALPDVLKMMDEKLDWTQQLGDAFLAQQKEVMAMVQTLRKKAQEEGNLKSDEHMKVSEEPAPAAAPTAATTVATTTTTVVPSTTTIVIQPADPEVIYVPTYSPTVVYGSWWYPAYPPYYFPPPVGYYPGAGLAWGIGVGISVGIWHGVWDNHCDWHGGDININRDTTINRGDVNIGSGNTNIDRGNRGQNASATNRSGSSWSHDPEHRKGASYRDTGTAQKYGGAQASTRQASGSRTGASASTRPSTGAGGSAATRPAGGGASASTRPAGGGASPTISGGASGGVRSSGGSSGTLSGGNLTAGSSYAGSGSGGGRSSSVGGSSASRPSGGSSGSARVSSVGGSSSRGGAYSGMSSGSRAGSYGSRGGASRGGGGMSRGGGGGRGGGGRR